MTTTKPAEKGAAGQLKETKARGWEIDARGKVRIIEPIAGDPPDEYYVFQVDRGNVVEIKEVKLKAELALTGEVEYDSGRRACKSLWKDRKGKLISTFNYTYDERGFVTKREEVGKAGRVLSLTTCTCDQGGNLVEERYHKGEEFLGRNLYTHDGSGRIATETHHNAADEKSGSYHFVYDSAGRLIERSWHNVNGDKMTTFKYTLDGSGRRIRAELVRKGVIESIQEFKYDTRGNMLEERWFEADGTLIRTIPYR